MTIADGDGAWHHGVLSFEPSPPVMPPLPAGVQWPLGFGDGTPALLVPASLAEGPVPLVVLLHGASSNPAAVLPILRAAAERLGFLVLAPKSAGRTWDAIRGGLGPDVGALDRALAAVSGHFTLDPGRVAIAGFSDGASYALALGLANGALFRRILAFSPGFVPAGRRVGRPAVFVSHGTDDAVLSIDRCSRRIVPALRGIGYDVEYREFVGGHEVPAELVTAATRPLVGG